MKFLNEIDGADKVKQDSDNRFVTDTQINLWDSKWDFNEDIIKAVKVNSATNADTVNGKTVAVNVPSEAKFTDTTYSEITTTEIDAGTASTLKVVTGRRIKYILDKVSSMISVAIGALTKSSVGLGNVDNTSDANKPISTATQSALNGKVNNSQVLTDVPSGAKFTDTVTTINDKTGAIGKADIVALGIPSQDTIYNHPSTHPASMITESSTKRFVSDSEKSTWNSKSDTDTVTTINGKTGAISKADIVALGIPSQDTVVDISGKADKSYVDDKVKTDVPINAVFTDTKYSVITQAEAENASSTTARLITGQRLKQSIDKHSVAYIKSNTAPSDTSKLWLDTSG